MLPGWYTETTPNNRMLLSLRSGIDSEIEWALDRLCRLCHNEQFLLKAIPGLTEALYEWPEYYVREGAQKIAKTQGMFSLDPVYAVHTRHALDSLFVLRNSASNEPNATELSKSPRAKRLVISILHNIQPDSSTNVEFLSHAIDLLYTIIPSVLIPKTSDSLDDPIGPLDELAGSSKDRSLIISSLNCLNAIYANSQSNLHRITEDSPAFRASLQYLPLFVDKPLVDAAVNYLYSYLSHPAMTKSFLFHKDMPSVLKLLVNLMIHEQVEEKVEEDITGEVKAAAPPEYATKVHDLTSEELEMLLPRGEPQRCFDWCGLCFSLLEYNIE
jgi:chromatin structure-remodeling complex subunit RSC9